LRVAAKLIDVSVALIAIVVASRFKVLAFIA
jgi:hypothetical protein